MPDVTSLASMSSRTLADGAHMEVLTAKDALDHLTNLVVTGSLDPSNDAHMSAFAVYSNGIATRLDIVADALSELAHRS